MRSPVIRLVLANALAMVLVAVVVLQPDVVRGHAGHFGSDYDHSCDNTWFSQCIANDGYHLIFNWSTSGDQLSAGMSWTPLVYTPANSDVTITQGCSGATAFCDVLLAEGSYGSNGYWAWTECEFAATHGGNPATHRAWCYPEFLKFNLTYKSNYNSLDRTRAIACHEMGHTLGLRHNSATDSCMHSPPVTPSVPTNQKNPSLHDTSLLKGYY